MCVERGRGRPAAPEPRLLAGFHVMLRVSEEEEVRKPVFASFFLSVTSTRMQTAAHPTKLLALQRLEQFLWLLCALVCVCVSPY